MQRDTGIRQVKESSQGRPLNEHADDALLPKEPWRDSTLASEEPIRKLKIIDNLLPGYKPEFYNFCRTLAEKLPTEITPQGFILALSLHYVDCYGKLDTDPLWLLLPEFTEAIFPKDFAQDVMRAYQELP